MPNASAYEFDAATSTIRCKMTTTNTAVQENSKLQEICNTMPIKLPQVADDDRVADGPNGCRNGCGFPLEPVRWLHLRHCLLLRDSDSDSASPSALF